MNHLNKIISFKFLVEAYMIKTLKVLIPISKTLISFCGLRGRDKTSCVAYFTDSKMLLKISIFYFIGPRFLMSSFS